MMKLPAMVHPLLQVSLHNFDVLPLEIGEELTLRSGLRMVNVFVSVLSGSMLLTFGFLVVHCWIVLNGGSQAEESLDYLTCFDETICERVVNPINKSNKSDV